MKKPIIISILLHAVPVALLIGAPAARPAPAADHAVSLVTVEVVSRPEQIETPAAGTVTAPPVKKERPRRAKETAAGDEAVVAERPRVPAGGGGQGTGETAGTVLITAQAAGTGPSAAGPVPASPALAGDRGTGGAAARDFSAEYQAIRTAIERTAKRSYPMSARKLGVQGVATVRFVVGPDGGATEITLVASSGSETLDEAARAIVLKAGPYPAVPGPVQIPIRFSLDG